MKSIILLVFGCLALLVTGCASSSCPACKPASPGTATHSQVYNPATDTTTITDGGFTWHVKGNLTNMVVTPAPSR